MRGLPIDADMEFTGNLFTLLNPMRLLGGLVTLGLFLTHGAFFLALKTTGQIRADARAHGAPRLGLVTAVLAVVLLAVLGAAARQRLVVAHHASSPRSRSSARSRRQPRGREGWAFIGTAVTIAMAVATYFLLLFPERHADHAQRGLRR